MFAEWKPAGGLAVVPMADPYYRRLGQRVKDAIRAAGMSQEDVAAALGMSGPGFNQWLSGSRKFPMDQVERVANLLGKPVWEIAGWESPPEADAVFGMGVEGLNDDDKQRVRDLAQRLRQR